MADQAITVDTKDAAAAAASPAHGGEQHLEHTNGRAISWVGVLIAIVGSIIGGAAFIPHPVWWLFWVAVGVFFAGILVLAGAKTVHKDWY